jgi:branched-chain amino acid transport system permease protein
MIRPSLGFSAISLVIVLAGCGLSTDSEQSRICRSALPALNSDGRVRVLRIDKGALPRSVQIEYEVERADRRPLDRTATCQFAGEGLSPDKAVLTGIITERGPLPEPDLYFLKRFYLGTPEGVAGDPGGGLSAEVVEVPEPVAYSVQQLLVSLPRTAIYALLAAAYALVFGLVGRINLAFGELAAVGAAATVAGASLALAFGITSPLLGLAAGLCGAVFAGALHSVVGGHFTIARIRSASPQPSLIATVGLSLFLMEYLRLAQSPVTVWLPPVSSEAWPLMRAGDFLVSLTPISLVTAGIGLIAGLALLLIMHDTTFGRAWRAYADDAGAAGLFGVDGPRLLQHTLGLAGAMAGLSGMLIVAQ